MKYVTKVDQFLYYYFQRFLSVEQIDFVNSAGLEYLLQDELIQYLNEHKDESPDLYALLADLYYKGKYVEEDYQKAKDLYDEGIKLESLFCMYKKANLLIDSVDLEYKEAFDLLQRASEKNFPPAVNNLAWMYSKGLGCGIINQSKASELFQKAAELGSVLGMCNYGRSLMKENPRKGIEVLKKAAELGSVSAQNLLGHYFLDGDFVEQDYEKTYNWFKKAAINGDSFAFKNLAKMYQDGCYVKQDKEMAEGCYKMAIQLGNEFAKKDLARMLEEMETDKEDLQK